jgi:hypothetical protein
MQGKALGTEEGKASGTGQFFKQRKEGRQNLYWVLSDF